MDGPSVIRCDGVTKDFGAGPVVNGVSLDLKSGEVLVLVGPSGSGKTTLLRLVAGFETPDQGAIFLEGKPAFGPNAWMPPEARNLGMVFQDYALFPHLKVVQNVEFGLKGWTKDSKSEKAHSLLKMVHLEHLAERYPYQLSGGEQQRVALARSLAPNPLALLLDEPLSNLDPQLRSQLRREIKGILSSEGVTALYVTHDQDTALFMGDRIAVMNRGLLEQVGTPEEIFYQPATRFVARFLELADFVPARSTEAGLETEIGVVCTDPPVAVGTEVALMVRPQNIDIRPCESGKGKIVARTFRGSNYLYNIALPSGVVVHTLQRYSAPYQCGASVEVSLEPHQMLTCFVANGSSADGKMESTFLVSTGDGRATKES